MICEIVRRATSRIASPRSLHQTLQRKTRIHNATCGSTHDFTNHNTGLFTPWHKNN